VASHPKIADIRALISLLLERDVEFILVGGAAAVAHGASTGTQDVDIVHARTAENVARLQALLLELNAYFRSDLSGRQLAPTPEHLAGRGQLLLTTALGPLDLLGALHDGRGYEELLPHTVELAVDRRALQILDLSTLIQVKTAAGRPKDKVVVAELLALLSRP
jgi:predicted nucleotidyltransferase